MPKTARTSSKPLAWLSLLLAAITVVLLLMGYRSQVGPFAVGSLTFLALFCMRHPFLKSYAFTIWVFAFVAASMFYPQGFMAWGGYDLKGLIVPLIQIIMFGMGTTLSVADFTRVLKMPWPVFVGFTLQFTIMPLTGFVLAKAFGFSNEIAAGVILIGCSPSGLASNVMAYLSGGDVALSVTITSCTTLAAPIMTPLWMKALAGTLVEVEFLKMMFDIINMIIVPIAAGLIANRILYSRQRLFRRPVPLVGIVMAAIGMTFLSARYYMAFADRIVHLLGLLFASDLKALLPLLGSLKNGVIFGFALLAVVALAKLVISVWLGRTDKWMDKALPIVSMAAICCIIAVITARSRNDLLTVGPWLIGSSIIHNLFGYLLAYWISRAIRLKESACRTVAFEVGMQNGGLASALAMNVLKSPQAALASAIFGPWQNISGSILATYWHRKPAETAFVAIPNPKQA
jgi:BASS family bile acid:Na+ symporter